MVLQHLRASHFGDHLPGLVQDGQPLRLRRVSTGETVSQRSKQKVLDMGQQQHELPSSFITAKSDYEAFQFMTSDLGEASLVTVFDHSDEIGGTSCNKLRSECPHD